MGFNGADDVLLFHRLEKKERLHISVVTILATLSAPGRDWGKASIPSTSTVAHQPTSQPSNNTNPLGKAGGCHLYHSPEVRFPCAVSTVAAASGRVLRQGPGREEPTYGSTTIVRLTSLPPPSPLHLDQDDGLSPAPASSPDPKAPGNEGHGTALLVFSCVFPYDVHYAGTDDRSEIPSCLPVTSHDPAQLPLRIAP